MVKSKLLGMMIFVEPGQTKSVFDDEKYANLAQAFQSAGFTIKSISYNIDSIPSLLHCLEKLDGLLVWVNPIEQGHDRSDLDKILERVSAKGVFVSTRPEIILKMGTKRVLHETRNLDFGSAVELYSTRDEFEDKFFETISNQQIRVLKQYRGDGGNGVYKVSLKQKGSSDLQILHAKRGSTKTIMTIDEFTNFFSKYFEEGKPLLNQPWNENLDNGIVRCYFVGRKVTGFGYQEINALYPHQDGPVLPGRRYYYSERCGLFSDLRTAMEEKWVSDLCQVVKVQEQELPVIWDIDLFINRIDGPIIGKYELCEINVSCVSPFPESSIPKIVEEISKKIT